MTENMKIGIMGCGAVSGIYIRNLKYHFNNVDVISCSDLFPEKAKKIKEEYTLAKAYSNEDMLNDPEVEIILNLTVPGVHYELNKAILQAGKHLYCEKPLAMTAAEAVEIAALGREKGLRVSDAPDTFLGPGVQAVRKLLDENAIGGICGFTANRCGPGHECWHPSPMFYYEPGGGPMRDIGPYYITALISLLGPVEEVFCYDSVNFKTRYIKGKEIRPYLPTHYTALMKFASGVHGNINMSWDVWYNNLPDLEIYGETGMISAPDPNMTQGTARIFRSEPFMDKMNSFPVSDAGGRQEFLKYNRGKEEYYYEVPWSYKGGANMRGVGVAEMALAIREGKPHRASGEMAAHVVDILECMERSANEDRPIRLGTTCEKPEAFYPVADGFWSGDAGTASNF